MRLVVGFNCQDPHDALRFWVREVAALEKNAHPDFTSSKNPSNAAHTQVVQLLHFRVFGMQTFIPLRALRESRDSLADIWGERTPHLGYSVNFSVHSDSEPPSPIYLIAEHRTGAEYFGAPSARILPEVRQPI